MLVQVLSCSKVEKIQMSYQGKEVHFYNLRLYLYIGPYFKGEKAIRPKFKYSHAHLSPPGPFVSTGTGKSQTHVYCYHITKCVN